MVFYQNFVTDCALVVGILFLTRIAAVIWPAQIKKMMKKRVSRLSASTMRMIGIVMIITSILLFYLMLPEIPFIYMAALTLPIGLLIGGTLLLVTRLAKAFWREDIEVSDMGMRIIAGIEVTLGLILIYLVLIY